jgi:hypothetical protein
MRNQCYFQIYEKPDQINLGGVKTMQDSCADDIHHLLYLLFCGNNYGTQRYKFCPGLQRQNCR